MNTANPTNLLQVEAPRRVPGILLWLSTTALISCSLIAASAYLYSEFTVGVSEYRRHLNDGAYRAQLVLDQREALLRALAATAVHADKHGAQQLQLDRQGPALQALDLPATSDDVSWQLAVTPRMLGGLALADAQLIHTAVAPLRSHVLVVSAAGGMSWVELPQDHIPAAIDSMPLPDHEHRPVTWLHQPGGDASLLAVYAPVDRNNASSGWVGLQLANLQQALQLPELTGINYALLDSHGGVVLRSDHAPAYLDGMQEDHFGLRREQHVPHDIVLSKSIGSGGLRVVYSVPVRQLLDGARGTVLRTLAMELAFVVLVLSAALAAQRLFLAPAQRQHQALLDSVELNRTLIATAPVGLALVNNRDGSVLRQNDLARHWMQHDPGWLERLVVQAGGTCHANVDLDDKRHVQVTSVPLLYRGQQVSLCVVSDITLQKQTEASLVAARTMAERASHAKTEFLATMSHEIRTPLYGLTGTLELLAAAGGDARQRRYHDLLRRSATALVRTVNDSLDLSRIESGHMVLQPGPFCLITLVDETIASFVARAEGKGLRLYAVADIPPIGDVVGDAQHIRQILANLISNAIKFTDAGQVALRVKAFTRADGCLQVIFQVCDTGSGVPADAINHLFDPYYRAGDALSRKVPGTGLGLAISNRLALLMGGSLQAVSQPGLGMRVSLELALAKAEDDSAGAHRYPRLQHKPVYVAGLLPEVVANLCRWLSRWGALAVPCTGAMQQMDADAVLLHAWPPAAELPVWSGREVVLRPATTSLHVDGDDAVVSAPAHAMLEIGMAVQRAQLDQVASPVVKVADAPLALRVMVVDDSPINQLIVKAQLDVLGCEVVLADGGQRALQWVDLDGFDAILTDLNMPSMSGYDLTEALRDRGYRGLILGTSADALPDTQGKWWSAGMDAMLVRPLSLSTLREHLRAAQRPEV